MKKNNMQRNQITDDELEQVSGGRKLWDVLTTEFVEVMGQHGIKAKTLEITDDDVFRVNTLEMRAKPERKQDAMDAPKVVKL